MTANGPDDRTEPEGGTASAPPPPMPGPTAGTPPPPTPGPPTMAGPPPASTPTIPRQLTMGPGQIVVLIGVVAVAVSMFLNWLDVTISALGTSRSTTATASSVPFAFLFDHLTTTNDPSILIALIPIVVLVLADVLLFRHRIVTFIGAIVTMVLVGLYAYQLDQLAGTLNDRTRDIFSLDAFDLLGIGAYVAFAGGLAMLVGALITRPATRATAPAFMAPPGPGVDAPPPTFGAAPTPPPTLSAPPATELPEAPPAPAPLDAPPEPPQLETPPAPAQLDAPPETGTPPESSNPG